MRGHGTPENHPLTILKGFSTVSPVIVDPKGYLESKIRRCKPQNSVEVANFSLTRRFLPVVLDINTFQNILYFIWQSTLLSV